ncbi:MAG: CinA family protein, partial [Pseudomonadota bacterium]
MSEALFSPSLRAAAEALLAAARRKGLTIATAESCTGGLIAG